MGRNAPGTGVLGSLCRRGRTCWRCARISLFPCPRLVFCSLSSGLLGGPDWVLLMTCLSAAIGALWARCRTASGLLGYCSDMACQHYLLLCDAVCVCVLVGGGTLISDMNKHGRRRVSLELLNAKMELRLYLRDELIDAEIRNECERRTKRTVSVWNESGSGRL